MHNSIKVILASGSKNRSDLLASLGIVFSVINSTINEEEIDDPDLGKKVQAIARAKAKQVVSTTQGLIIAADTFSAYKGQQYHKPKSLDEAKMMLRVFSGNIRQVLTGVCVINTYEKREVTALNVVNLQCKHLTEEEISEYVSTKPVMEWAAAYNPLDPLSASMFKPMGTYEYPIEYYGVGISTVITELQRAGINIRIPLKNP